MATNPAAGQYTVVYTGSQGARPVTQQQLYNNRQVGLVKRMAISQIIMGAVSIICGLYNIFVISYCQRYYSYGIENIECFASANGFVGAGIWVGVFLIITGSIAASSAHKNTSRWINASIVMNIISSVFCTVLFGVAVADICYMDTTANKALDALDMVIALCQLIITIIVAAFGCRAVCSCCKGGDERQPLIQNFGNPPLPGNLYGGTNPHQAYNPQLPPAAVHNYQVASPGYPNYPQQPFVAGQQQYQSFNNPPVYFPAANAQTGQFPADAQRVHQSTHYTLPADPAIRNHSNPPSLSSAPPLNEESAEFPDVGNMRAAPPPYQAKADFQ